MAIFSKTGITTGNTIQAWHVTQSIDAFTGLTSYDVTLSGSLTLTGSVQSQNGYTGSLFGTASWAVRTLSSSYAETVNQANTIKVSESLSTTPLAIALLNQTSSDNSAIRFDNDDFRYQPSTNTLYVSNLEGTASLAISASYAETASVSAKAYPIGSIPTTNPIYFVVGSAQTDNSITPTVTVTITELATKILGQDCFVTIGASGSALMNPAVCVKELLGTSLTFESTNPNTDFYYHIIYS